MKPAETSLARPFRALRPAPDRADAVASPPYDVVSTAEARALADGRPYSFLHVSRAEINFADTIDPYSDEVYAAAAENLRRFEHDGVLLRDAQAGFYIYRMTRGSRAQTGIAFAASVDAYLDGRIRKHELTRPAKENDRVKQIDAVNAITGPVFLVHRALPDLARLLDRASARAPDTSAADVDGVRHDIWAVFDADTIADISACFNRSDRLYIADGHHRSAAAARIAEARRAAHPDYSGAEAFNGFLAVSFPDSEVDILDYNRLVRDLNGHSTESLLAALRENFTLAPRDAPVSPSAALSYGLYVAGQWYALTLKAAVDMNDPVARLDVSVLDNFVLAPLLGIDDPRTSPRIDFVGGSRGPDAIAARVDSGEMALGFMLHPTALADLMSVADADQIMPPKSTWFDPKLADGLLSLPLDD